MKTEQEAIHEQFKQFQLQKQQQQQQQQLNNQQDNQMHVSQPADHHHQQKDQLVHVSAIKNFLNIKEHELEQVKEQLTHKLEKANLHHHQQVQTEVSQKSEQKISEQSALLSSSSSSPIRNAFSIQMFFISILFLVFF